MQLFMRLLPIGNSQVQVVDLLMTDTRLLNYENHSRESTLYLAAQGVMTEIVNQVFDVSIWVNWQVPWPNGFACCCD